MVKAMMPPAMMPGMISGRVTLKKDCMGVHPRSMAASVREESICFSLGMTFRMT